MHTNGHSYSAKVYSARGNHYWKTGVEYKHSGGVSIVTANTFDSPDTRTIRLRPHSKSPVQSNILP
jgi:hypothetical protein